MEEINNKIEIWNKWLTTRQKRYIHFYSVRNFVVAFPELKDGRLKEEVLELLTLFIAAVESEGHVYSPDSASALISNYLKRISEIYTRELGFRAIISFRFVVFFGLVGDGILYFLLRDSISYLPVISALLVANFLYIRFHYGKRGKVFGIFY